MEISISSHHPESTSVQIDTAHQRRGRPAVLDAEFFAVSCPHVKRIYISDPCIDDRLCCRGSSVGFGLGETNLVPENSRQLVLGGQVSCCRVYKTRMRCPFVLSSRVLLPMHNQTSLKRLSSHKLQCPYRPPVFAVVHSLSTRLPFCPKNKERGCDAATVPQWRCFSVFVREYCQRCPPNASAFIYLCRLPPCFVLVWPFSSWSSRCHRLVTRTAALMALIAVSIVASGATPPSLLSIGSPDGGASSNWLTFLSHGLALPCLANHFQGFGSASVCM